MKELELGKYQHYKGGLYEVIGVATNSETMESLVIYRALYKENSLWARPLIIFSEDVEYEGGKVPRFKYVGE